MKTVAVVPVYNEAETVIDVLRELESFVDDILIVNDGSRDESEAVIAKWLLEGHQGELVTLDKNRGYAKAILTGYALLNERLTEGRIESDDIIVSIDADGQHRPKDIPRLLDYLVEKKFDGVRARRRLDQYPLYKQAGNKVLSLALSPVVGQRIFDALSGYCLLRAHTLPVLLDYTIGYQYTVMPEIAVILARSGLMVSDRLYVDSPCRASHTRLRDAFMTIIMGLVAFAKVELGLKSKSPPAPPIARRVEGRKRETA